MLLVDLISQYMNVVLVAVLLMVALGLVVLKQRTVVILRLKLAECKSKMVTIEARLSELFDADEEGKAIIAKAYARAQQEENNILERARFQASLIVSASNSYSVNKHIELNDRLRSVRVQEQDAVTLARFIDARGAELLESASNCSEQLILSALKNIEDVEHSASIRMDRQVEQSLMSIAEMESEIQKQSSRLSEIKKVEGDCINRIREMQDSAHALEMSNAKAVTDLKEVECRLYQQRDELAEVQRIVESKCQLVAEIEVLELRVSGLKRLCVSEKERYEQSVEELVNKYGRSVDALAIEDNISDIRQSYLDKKAIYDDLLREIASAEMICDLQDSGVYASTFDFSDSNRFRDEIEFVRDQQKKLVSEKVAVTCSTTWTVNESVAQGRVMTNKAIKLTLRAFNGACDAAIRGVKWNNVISMMARIEKERERITKLNSSNNIFIGDDYYDLKLKELRLTHEHREKIKEEREERQAASRALKEEQKLLRDMELAEQEELKYKNLLDMALAEATELQGVRLEAYQEKINLLQAALEEAHEKYVRAQSMAEMTKSGWVYIVSNIGSFGPDIVKIGLTRRLDPTDRVRELGAAGVPFVFDTHALIYSDNAPALERSLHLEFAAKRVNTVNLRKEFFRVSLAEVEEAVKRLSPDSPFIVDIEAQDYHQTRMMREALLKQDVVSASSLFPLTI